MRKLVWIAVIFLSAALLGTAQAVPPGYDAASFVRVGMGARAQAMGGAFTAVA